MIYECFSCGTTFKEEEGELKNGWLTCPSCGDEELKEILERNEDEDRTSK